MVYNVVFWLNVFPQRDGVHEVMSPRTILTGLHINHDKHCTLEFGSYVQIHEEHDNSMAARTSGAIALRPTGNLQGSHYFLNVSSGRRVTRNNWTALPMPNEVIHAVHRLAAACKKFKGIVFTDSKGNIIDDDNSPKNEAEIAEITGVGNTTYPVTYPVNSTGVGNITDTIGSPGVRANSINENENADSNTTPNEDENTGVDVTYDEQEETEGELPVPELQEIHTTQETEEHTDETYGSPTRQELETLEEMNATNMGRDTEHATEHIGTNSQIMEPHNEHMEAGSSASHGYNLRPRPTRQHEK